MHSHAGLAGYHSSLKPRATPHGPSTAAEEVGQPPHRLTGRPTAHRATMAALRAHLAGLNDWSASFDACPVTDFKLEEEIVSFAVSAGAATGRVNLSLEERSAYPRTGALAFADGSEELVRAVETASTAISRGAALDAVVRALVEGLPVDAAVEGLPAPPALAAASVPTAKSDDDMEDDDDDDDDDDEMDDDMDYGWERGAELENQLRLRHSWELKDQERRQLAGEPAPAEAGAPEAAPAEPRSGGDGGVKAPKKGEKAPAKRGAHQIFTAHEATRILCNELFDLMKEKLEGFDGIDADCVDRDVHTWRVRITDVNEASPLHGDLAALGRRLGGGAAAIELELRFTPDMHPFYPAFVKVVRPRFEGYAAEALMAHPLLTLGGWDPMKSVKWLLRFAQGFLETHGRVALDDARNDAAAHPSAYAAAEHALCRLELLSGARPAWAAAHPALFAGRGAEVDTERVRELNFGKRQKSDDEKAKGGWARGVGYGHSATEGGATWDIVATEKAQEQVDVEMRALLGEARARSGRRGAGGRGRRGVVPARAALGAPEERLPPRHGQGPRAHLDVPRAARRAHQRRQPPRAPRRHRARAARRRWRDGVGRRRARSDAPSGRVLRRARRRRADGAAAGAAVVVVGGVAQGGGTSRGRPRADARASHPRGGARVGGPWPTRRGAHPCRPRRPRRRRRPRHAQDAEHAELGGGGGGGQRRRGAAVRVGGAARRRGRGGGVRARHAPAAVRGGRRDQGSKYGDAPAGSSQARTKRLAMEAADMVGGSLPCSASSTTWARVDERSMHLWRAMISGPEDTPCARSPARSADRARAHGVAAHARRPAPAGTPAASSPST